MLEAPIQDFLVRTAREHLLNDVIIIHLQKTADSRVSAGAVFVVRRQFSFMMEPDFIKHPAEENQTSNLFRRMPQARNFHRGRMNGFGVWRQSKKGTENRKSGLHLGCGTLEATDLDLEWTAS